jgi:hypothetical protein
MGDELLALSGLDLTEFPSDVRDIIRKLVAYGFKFHKTRGTAVWAITGPDEGLGELDQGIKPLIGMSNADGSETLFVPNNPAALKNYLPRIYRAEEERRGAFVRYKQGDKRWRDKVYGVKKDDTTIGAAGCGPTSLAIVLHFLMNNGSRTKSASILTPEQAAKYAEKNGRVSGHGTAGDPMIKGIKTQWPSFDGMRVGLPEVIRLVQKGKLVIFLCKGCAGFTEKNKSANKTDVSYGGHYMVLTGVEGSTATDRVFHVADPGRRESAAMRYIKQEELEKHTGGFWYVFSANEADAMICEPEPMTSRL